MMQRVSRTAGSLFVVLALVVPRLAMAERVTALLENMPQAMADSAWRGRLVYLRGAEMSTLEVLHASLDGQTHERLVHLDGAHAELIRRGDELVCLHPKGQVTRLDGGAASLNPLALSGRVSLPLPEQYQLVARGPDRVAGIDTEHVSLVPADGWRYGYQLWLAADTGMLLKSEILDGKGQVLERMEFVALDAGIELGAADFAAPAGIEETVLAPVDAPTFVGREVTLDAQWLPPGFAPVDGDTRLAAGEPVTARSFTDGLATFTVFAEPASDGGEGVRINQMGPTLAVSAFMPVPPAGFDITLIGEVPPATAEKVLAGLNLVLEPGVD